jgi:cytoskeletal protein CcmA (bactofilin family)
MQNKFTRLFVSAILLSALALSIATPVAAFDGRGGDDIVIGPNEVINDDLYVGAQNFTLDGTVNGDVVVAGEVMTINGTVDGDVMAAGQTIIVNGTVTGSIRIAGAALFIGEKAKIGGDVVAAGASLETRPGSQVGRDVVFFGGQTLLAGDITRNLKVFAGGAELHGKIGGNVEAEVGQHEEGGPGPMVYVPQSPIAIPTVKGGLNIDPAAKIGGELTYTSTKELTLPAGIVAGKVTRHQPEVAQVVQPTLAELLMTGVLDAVRKMVTLILLGLLLGWFFPALLAINVNQIRATPLPAFGWGIVGIAAFWFALLVLMVATIVGALLFGALTLGSLSGVIVFLGLLLFFALILGFVLAAIFLAPILVSLLVGKLILEKINPDLAEHRVWPLVLGVFLFAALGAIPCLGGVLTLVVILLGLGALWIYGRGLLKKPALAAA